MTEEEKMKCGKWYDANNDPLLIQQRLKADSLSQQYNSVNPIDRKTKDELLNEMIGSLGKDCEIVAPLYVDYGTYVTLGDHCFINRNAYLMDGGGITIGSRCFIGPSCGLYTAVHPLHYEDRNKGLEKALPIVIGNNCWLGADVKVMPGVSIGNNVVIGAGSIVTKNIESNVLAMGNPCKVVRVIDENDKLDFTSIRGDV